MAKGLQPVQGMSDLSGGELRLWQGMEATARRVFAAHGFSELRTPLLEDVSLFTRAVGETTSVVRKEMYDFEKGHLHLALRPEGTAGVIRHASTVGAQEAAGARWFYIGPMFRHERPQAGRRRQFHQAGVECLAPPSPRTDAEILSLQVDLLRAWGIEARARVNTRGAAGDHVAVAAGLKEALAPHRAALCADCQRRMDENVLRVLDCKNPACGEIVAGLPPVTTWMGDEAKAYFAETLRLLGVLGVEADVSPLLVRGLDYYEHTIWEITGATGAQDALAGGGRYRMDLGGEEWCGVGFAIGLERVAGLLAATGKADAVAVPPAKLAWLVGMGPAAEERLFRTMRAWRADGIPCRMGEGSLKKQMRQADKAGAAYAVLCGDAELAAGTLVVKDMASGEQRALPEAEARATLRSLLA
ncbi:MAG: histidine--tRNA ligase [Kiritimatiellae bacterium]|nr:histidine--tRNA ligase [Kiritimatiellia bacterium]